MWFLWVVVWIDCCFLRIYVYYFFVSMSLCVYDSIYLWVVVIMCMLCTLGFVSMSCCVYKLYLMSFCVYELLCLWVVMSINYYLNEFCQQNHLSMKRFVSELLCLLVVVSMSCCFNELLCFWDLVSMKCCVYELLCLCVFVLICMSCLRSCV